jgi:hypothetical protein
MIAVVLPEFDRREKRDNGITFQRSGIHRKNEGDCPVFSFYVVG